VTYFVERLFTSLPSETTFKHHPLHQDSLFCKLEISEESIRFCSKFCRHGKTDSVERNL